MIYNNHEIILTIRLRQFESAWTRNLTQPVEAVSKLKWCGTGFVQRRPMKQIKFWIFVRAWLIISIWIVIGVSVLPGMQQPKRMLSSAVFRKSVAFIWLAVCVLCSVCQPRCVCFSSSLTRLRHFDLKPWSDRPSQLNSTQLFCWLESTIWSRLYFSSWITMHWAQ